MIADDDDVSDYRWPVLMVVAGLIAPWLGSVLFLSGFERFNRDHPDEFPAASGQEMAHVERRMWGLPIGALMLGPALIVARTAWLIWVLLS